MLVGLLPWRGGAAKCGMLPKLGLLASTCYNNRYRRRGFNSDRRRRHLQGGNKPVIFNDIYESSFLPPLWSLDLDGTFVGTDGGG